MVRITSSILLLFPILFIQTYGLDASIRQGSRTLHARDYFYIGQSYVKSPTSADGQIAFGQLYVEHLTPVHVTNPYPLLFIHGNGMTGTNFLNTPDGRLGWAEYFLSKGYEVYLVDQPSRGRSAWQQYVDGAQSIFDTLAVESRFTATGRFNLWPQAQLHTQWPGNGSVGDPTFDAFYASIMPSLASLTEASQRVRDAGAQLLDMVGPVILVTHSQSGAFGWVLGDARPSKIKAIIALEPTGPPFVNAIFPPLSAARPYGLTDIPVAYSPPILSPSDLQPTAVNLTSWNYSLYTCYLQMAPARTMINLVNIPITVITSESGYHAVYDDCSVEYLRQAGVEKVDFIKLDQVGIWGNGHMFFMELNGLEIARDVVEPWIEALRL